MKRTFYAVEHEKRPVDKATPLLQVLEADFGDHLIRSLPLAVVVPRRALVFSFDQQDLQLAMSLSFRCPALMARSSGLKAW